MGGTNQYYQGARTFVASGTTATVTFANTKNVADTTLVLDDVKVESATEPGWTVGNWTGDGKNDLRGVPRGTAKKLRLIAYHFGYRGLAGSDKIGYGGPWEAMRILTYLCRNGRAPLPVWI